MTQTNPQDPALALLTDDERRLLKHASTHYRLDVVLGRPVADALQSLAQARLDLQQSQGGLTEVTEERDILNEMGADAHRALNTAGVTVHGKLDIRIPILVAERDRLAADLQAEREARQQAEECLQMIRIEGTEADTLRTDLATARAELAVLSAGAAADVERARGRLDRLQAQNAALQAELDHGHATLDETRAKETSGQPIIDRINWLKNRLCWDNAEIQATARALQNDCVALSAQAGASESRRVAAEYKANRLESDVVATQMLLDAERDSRAAQAQRHAGEVAVLREAGRGLRNLVGVTPNDATAGEVALYRETMSRWLAIDEQVRPAAEAHDTRIRTEALTQQQERIKELVDALRAAREDLENGWTSAQLVDTALAALPPMEQPT